MKGVLMHDDPSEIIQQQVGLDTSDIKSEVPIVTEAELAAQNNGMDAEDAYASLDDADKAIWDASVHPVKS